MLTGDAEGIIILWDLAIKRPAAVWRAHTGGVLGIGLWNDSTIITHGRDGKLNAWQLRLEDEDSMSKGLPVEESTKGDWKQPWSLHSLQVHTLNFCAFAMCHAPDTKSILVGTPAANEGLVVIHELPSEKVRHLVPPAEAGKTGMVMVLRMLFMSGALHVVTGYESGLTSVQRLKPGTEHSWETISSCQPHTQPILSLDLSLDSGVYYTSAADANIATACLTRTNSKDPIKLNATKHAGQQGLSVRSDGKILATAGWDGRMRIYSAKTLKEVAVLKWHKEGCYAVAFAEMIEESLPTVEVGRAPMPDSEDAKVDHAAEGSVSLSRARQITTVRQQRENRTRETHWLAAGSKDGKVSLWNVF